MIHDLQQMHMFLNAFCTGSFGLSITTGSHLFQFVDNFYEIFTHVEADSDNFAAMV